MQVALSVFSLIHVTAIHFGIWVNPHLSFALFFATIASYNFVKYGVEAAKYVVMTNAYLKQVQLISMLALVLAFYHLYFLKLDVWIGLGLLTFLSGLYALPVLPNAKNLRSLGGFKIFIVAVVWAGTTVVLPLLEAGIRPSWDYGVEFLQRFLLVLILILPFEIRDLKYDPLALQTLPQRYGVLKTKQIGIIFTTALFLITFLKDTLTTTEIIANTVLVLGLCILLWATKKNQNAYFSPFWVESVPIMWWGLHWFSAHYL